MVKARILFVVMVAALTGGLLSAPAFAADTTSQITDTQAEQIRQNCKQAQSTLQRLQTTDVATRVNRGRIYESLLNNLLAPLNSRVSLNRYNASDLSAATTTISQKFALFKSDYQSYADTFSNLLSINCEANPRGFYSLLVTARGTRERISNDIVELNAGLDKYTEAFNSLRSSIGGQ